MEWSARFRVGGTPVPFLTLIGIYQFVKLAGALLIIGQPRSKAIHEGGSLTLECIVESKNPAYVIWYKEDSPGINLPLSSYREIRREAPEWERLSIVGSGNAYNLRIIDANTADESNYQCVAYSRGHSVRSEVARVTILPIGDSVNCHLYPQHVVIGAILNYTCRAPDSMHAAPLTWWHGGEPMSSVETLPEGGLRLRYVISEYDNYVRFTCTVGNNIDQAYGLNCSTVPLHIPLSGRLNPKFNIVSIGSNAAFRCSAVAAPRANRIKWLVGYGNNAKISRTGGRYEIKSNPSDASESTLIIKNIGTADNGTHVRCVVMNELKQKDIVTAYIIAGSQDSNLAQHTTWKPRISIPQIRTTQPVTQKHNRITTSTMLKTTENLTTMKITASFQTTRSQTRRHKPRFKDVEISVHDEIPTNGYIPSVDNGGTEKQDADNSSPPSNSSLIPTVASLFVLLVILLVASIVIYIVVFRRKLLNKNNLIGEVKYRQTSNTTAVQMTAEDRAAVRMSLRLQTIEVVVNQPPAEWESRLKDVKPTENVYTNFEPKIDIIPSSPPPAYTVNSSDMQLNHYDGNEQNCDETQNGDSGLEPEDDAIYALPSKKASKRDGDNVRDSHTGVKRQISDARKYLLSQDYNENGNDVDDDDIEWDQSSWDNSSFGDENETIERVHEGQMYSRPADTIYANAESMTDGNSNNSRDSYGPEYDNLPNLRADDVDSKYARVASLTNM